MKKRSPSVLLLLPLLLTAPTHAQVRPSSPEPVHEESLLAPEDTPLRRPIPPPGWDRGPLPHEHEGHGSHGLPLNTGEAVRLDVPCLPQQTQVWCWAAVVEAVLRYASGGSAPGQCRILSDFLLCDCCLTPFLCPQQCLVAAPSIATLSEAILFYSGHVSSIRGPMGFAEVMGELDAGRPIIVGYSGSFVGHVVTIYGYDLARQTVDICDPFYGDFRGVPFGATFSYGGQLVWSHSITDLPGGDGTVSPPVIENGGASDDDEDCPIAGTIYADPGHPDLDRLRAFRDRVLARLPGGRHLIEAYYANGPVLRRVLEDSEVLRRGARAVLVPVAGLAALSVEAPVLTGLLLALGLALGLRVVLGWLRASTAPVAGV